MEIMAAAALLAVAAGVGLQMVVVTASAQKKVQMRSMATHEVANLMERVMAIADDELTPESVNQIEISQEAKAALPEAKLAIRLDKTDGERLEAVRVTIELTWQSRAGEPATPTRLLAWRFRTTEAKP